MNSIIHGNFPDIINKRKGNPWIIGHFIEDKRSPFHISNFEVKWSEINQGESKDQEAFNLKAKTLTILIRGKFICRFKDQEVILENEGDYVYFEPGVSHTWSALEKSLLLSIRWPSIPGDQKKVDN